ncbi:MAG TPA: hypothetical protein VEO20_08990 [Thermoplasmata archaeon]|nr:hypothetical protein [Thermoplasmata archaeon]
MASDKPSPMLLDAVKASASKFKETKNALDARQRELDATKAELDAQRADLEKQFARLRVERDDFQRENEVVLASRATIERDTANARIERDRVAAEEKRVQDWAHALTEREKTIKDAEERLKHLEAEMMDHMKEAEGKIQALVEREELSAQRERALADTIDRVVTMERGFADRDKKLAKREEELIKLQNERLSALEARERETLKISEEMYERQKESAVQHESFVGLQTTLRDELNALASEREKLAMKERSLLEAEKYLAAALEATGIDMVTEETEVRSPPPPPAAEARPPRPPMATQASTVMAASPSETLRHELLEEEEGDKPKVSRADALEKMTRALETAKKARDSGKNVSDIRKALKQARAAFESGDYDTASRLAGEILRELEAVPLPR